MSGAVVSACDELLEALKLRSGSSGGGMGGGVGAEALVLGMLRLKAGNREAMALLEKREAAVAAQREKNDQARLRLENLLYRQAYLAREIRACDDFATSAAAAAEKELGGEPLIQQSHSADLASRHKRSLNRLAEEFESRRDKRAALAELRAAYASETGALDKKRRFLEELPSRLKDVASAVAQVEQHVLTSGGNAAPAESAAAAMTGLGRSAVLEAAATLPAQLYTLFHGLHALQASISSGTAQTAVEVPAGFTLCAEHGSSSSTTQWAYRTNVVDLAALGTAVDLDLRINFTTTGSPATAGDTASVTLRFTVTSGNLVCVSTHGLSFAAMYPFKPEDLLYNLYPGDSSASRTYLWLQWACGLRPLPPTPLQGTTRYGSSLGTVIHRVRRLCVHLLVYKTHYNCLLLYFSVILAPSVFMAAERPGAVYACGQAAVPVAPISAPRADGGARGPGRYHPRSPARRRFGHSGEPFHREQLRVQCGHHECPPSAHHTCCHTRLHY